MNTIPVQTEVVVIGSGAAGLAAALTAADGGAKVILFEKERSPGGTSNFLQGTFAVESSLQRERYIMYSRDEAFKSLMEYSHWVANPRLVRAIVNKSAETIGWLQAQGVVFTDATINMPDSPRTYHVIRGRGEALVKALVTRAREMGVDVRLAAPVKRLVKLGDRLTGVVAEIEGEETPFSAKAVIVASGGYANNKDWIKKYTGFELGVNLMPVGNVDKTGDGIRMAWEVGAADEGKSLLELYRAGPVGPDFSLGNQIEFAVTQPDLWVDPRGERFCDESICFYDSSVGNANARSKEGYTWSIFDDGVIRRLLERGVDKNVAIDSMPGAKPAGIARELGSALDKKSTEVVAADSLEALAMKMGVVPSVLKKTVEDYNACCYNRYDKDFTKDPKYLWPINKPWYYAVKARTVCLGTMGGIKINERAEVIDKKDTVIPGLYAAGFDAGGMYGDSYPIKCSSGLASAFAFNSGRIAGKNALKLLSK